MKKEKFVTKIFFSDKCCVRFFQINAVNVIKDLVAVSYKLYIRRCTFKTSNAIKKVCIFHLSLVGIPSILILSVKNRGVGVGRGGGGAGVA